MKAVSLSLKIVAIIAAAASVYFWADTRGKIASAEAHMKGVAGANLEEKAPKVPGLLKDLAKQKTTVGSNRKALHRICFGLGGRRDQKELFGKSSAMCYFEWRGHAGGYCTGWQTESNPKCAGMSVGCSGILDRTQGN